MRPATLSIPALALCTLASCAAPPQLQLAVFTGQGTARWGEEDSLAASIASVAVSVSAALAASASAASAVSPDAPASGVVAAPAIDHKVAFIYASPTPLHHKRLILNAPLPVPSFRTIFGLDEPDDASGWELDWDLDKLEPGLVAIWSFDAFKLGNGKGAAFESCRVVTSVDFIYGDPPRRVRVEMPLRLPDATALDIEPACHVKSKPVAKP